MASLVFFAGCGPQVDPVEEIKDVEFGEAVDLTNLFAQVCESKDGPCVIMQCALSEITYTCAESVAGMTKNCATAKGKDEVITEYKICGFESSEISEKYEIFNYGKSIELLQMAETPAQFEQKIAEETQKVEEGGSSDFLGTMMAVAAGSILGGMISNALFNSNSAMPPRSVATHKEEPFNKKKLQDSQKKTSENSGKIKDSVSKTKAQSKVNTQKKTAAKKAAARKKAAAQKNTSKRKSSKRRGFGRRR